MKKYLIILLLMLLVFLYTLFGQQLIRQMFLDVFTGPMGNILFFLPYIIFLLLGLALIVFALKDKIQGKLKRFLLLTGTSALGVFPFIILHNLTTALLSTIFKQEIEEPFFFILAVIICPIGFIVGSIGSIVLINKQK